MHRLPGEGAFSGPWPWSAAPRRPMFAPGTVDAGDRPARPTRVRSAPGLRPPKRPSDRDRPARAQRPRLVLPWRSSEPRDHRAKLERAPHERLTADELETEGRSLRPNRASADISTGKVEPLAIWFVPHGEGLAHPVDTVSPEREGHSVDPPDMPRQDVWSIGRSVRMESRIDIRYNHSCLTREMRGATGGAEGRVRSPAVEPPGYDERPGGGPSRSSAIEGGNSPISCGGPRSRLSRSGGGGRSRTPPFVTLNDRLGDARRRGWKHATKVPKRSAPTAA